MRRRVIFLIVLLSAVQTARLADSGVVPRFEVAPIPEEIAPMTGNVEFGYLVVYENRNIANGPVIKLPVMIGKSRNSNPRPDPVIFTVGGPGVISTMRGGRDLDSWPFLDDRDFIYFEQRGAQYAQPSLAGPEIDSVMLAGIKESTNARPARAELIAAVKRMKQRLTGEGIDLSCYSTRVSAADIEDLRRVLGIEKWNLYGVSYSCRLMLEVMRRYPEGVRAAILDSPLPPDASWDETSIERYWKNFVRLASACEADAAVRSKYPDLQNRFLELIREANDNPLAVSISHPRTGQNVTVELDGEGLFHLVAGYMGNGQYVYSFPRSIHLICDRNPEVLSYFAQGMLSPPQYAWGMRYSVWCNEEFPFEDFSKFSARRSVPPPLDELSWTIVEPEIYDIWPRRAVDTLDNQPVYSDIPSLVTSGQFDPDIPPQWGQKVCSTLSNAHYIEFPGQSHLPLFVHPCGKSLAIEFLNNPDTKPGEDCLSRLGPFKFYSGD